MFCPNCGKENTSGNSFCGNCGASFELNNATTFNNAGVNEIFNNPQGVNNVQTTKATDVLAIVGFVLALVGVFCLGILFGPAAIVLGAVAKNQIKTQNQGGNGLATAAIIIGIIDVVFVVIGIAASIFLATL